MAINSHNNQMKKSSKNDDMDEEEEDPGGSFENSSGDECSWIPQHDVDDNMNFGSSRSLMINDDSVSAESYRSSCSTSTTGTRTNCGWQGTFLSSVILVCLICLGLYFGRTYVKAVLTWMEFQNEFVILTLFIVFFTLVSFPFMWGYLLLNVVCGYLYGFVIGLLIVMFTVLVGTTIAHFVMRKFLSSFVSSKLSFNPVLKATLMVVGGPHTFRVIAITRLTPIPFGLQNALFAVSPIGSVMYLVATVVGLFPTQALNAYLGSTLRSMEDVLNDANTATTGYIVFAIQVVISICLTAYVVHKAKSLLREVMVESGELTQSTLTDIITSSDGIGVG